MVSSLRRCSLWVINLYHRINAWFAALVTRHAPNKNIAVLDGVRAVACVAVIIFHINLLTYRLHLWSADTIGPFTSSLALAGDSGVTLFFILSGFLLFLPYARSLVLGSDWPSARRFYLRRAFRIIPGYYACLFLLILLTHREYLHRDHLKQLGLFLTFFMDSSPTTYRLINGPFWTLAVEWQFYLLLPLLALGMRPLVRRGGRYWRVTTLVLCLIGLMACGVVTRYAGFFLTLHPGQSFGLPHSVLNIAIFFFYGTVGNGLHGKFLEDFAVGMLVSLCYVMAGSTTVKNSFHILLRRLSPWLWGLGLLWLVVMALWEWNQLIPHTWAFLDPAFIQYNYLHELGLSLGFGCCVVAVLFGSAALQALFVWAPLRWIGLVSYSLYMWHLPFLSLLIFVVQPYIQQWNSAALYSLFWLWVLLIIMPFVSLSFLIIEKPWMEMGERWDIRRRKKAEIHRA
ncbi:MAG TPA: acyltransferase [Ktedonobacteraceae bacterium]|nr:acyltransferase [Ktedonobacteraceae bacterium]